MTDKDYPYYPGGRPAWPTVEAVKYEAIPTRVCVACKVERKVTAFGVGSKKCSGCYSKEKRKRDKEKAEREGLKSGELTDHVDLYHGGAHSRAGA